MNVDRGDSGQHGRSPCFEGAIEYAVGGGQATGECMDGLDLGGALSRGDMGDRVPKTRTPPSGPGTIRVTGRRPSRIVQIAQFVAGAMSAAFLIMGAAIALLPLMGAILPLALVLVPFGFVFLAMHARAPGVRSAVRRPRLKSDVSLPDLRSVLGPASTRGAQPPPDARSRRAARRPLRVSVAGVPVKPGRTMPGVRVSEDCGVFVSESLVM